ncbi:MAG: RodZ domain-containing protein [Actinomycetes bacterium]|jgi:cytoskeleton protein RodZ
MSLGSALKSARTAAGLSVEELAARTRIRGALIKELENDNFVNCGGDTYARGHIRTIARILEIDGAQLLSEFTESFAPEERPMMDLLVENSAARPPREKKPISWKALSGIAASIVVIVASVQFVVVINKSNEVVKPVALQSTTKNEAPVVATKTTGVNLILTGVSGVSWVGIFDSSNNQIYSGRISSGKSQVFTDDQSLYVVIGNAGVINVNLNGSDLGVTGAIGEVVRMQFTPTGSTQG